MQVFLEAGVWEKELLRCFMELFLEKYCFADGEFGENQMQIRDPS